MATVPDSGTGSRYRSPAPDTGMMSALSALTAAAQRLEAAGVDSPLTDARLLLAHALGLPLTRLDVRLGSPLDAETVARFQGLVDERAARRPLAYVTGETEFMGLRFRCDERALVPRPDTETLVEAVMALLGPRAIPPLAGRALPCLLDLGTGTGCLGLSLAVLLPEARVVLTDASPDALALARGNAEALGVLGRVRLLEGPDLEPVLAAGLAEDITGVVSNPPYIAPGDVPSLPPEVADHEPRLAWLGEGPTGTGVYERLILQCAESLPNVRLAAFEIGLGQAPAVLDLCRRAWPTSGVHCLKDLSGIERVVIAQAR